MHETQKIPIEFLLKMSRQECGALKSYIQELEDTIKEKDKMIDKQQNQIKQLRKSIRKGEALVRVNTIISTMNTKLHVDIPKLLPLDRNRRKISLYKQAARYYNAWYEGCKLLIPLMDELIHPNKYENPESSSETTT